MISLFVDNSRCDIDSLPTIPINFNLANLTKADGARNGRSIEVTLPATPRNNATFGAARALYASKRFNMEHHTARIEKDGVTVFSGTIHLLSSSEKGGSHNHYLVRIDEGGAEWIESVAHGALSDLKILFSDNLTLATISSSWEGEQSVRFLPIYRGDYNLRYGSSNMPIERILLTDDYFPFISVADMVKAMLAESGYELRSRFLDSELGRSLYISGDYSRTNNVVAKAKCDFLARRAAKGEATADFMGRVYASKAITTHSVGSIVDTANPNVLDSEGNLMSDTFCTNNSFTRNKGGEICFAPKMSVRAGFLLHLEYTSDYKILSRERLRGFDTIEGLYGERVEATLANTYKDYRQSPNANWEYRCLVFDHTEGRKYKLLAIFEDGTSEIIKEWDSRSEIISTPSKKIVSLKLNYYNESIEKWMAYMEDWALYGSYVDEEGEVDVVMDFRITPQQVSAGEYLALDKFWFGGAEAGMKLTVGTATSLRPYFTSVPGYNASLEFKDVAPRNISQLELLTAIGEMFNLAFYSDNIRKEITIEPLEEFYANQNIVDWNSRIDHLSEIVISDVGVDMPQDFTLAYLDTDSATHHFNSENDTSLGRWSFRNPLYGSKPSTQRAGNSLFTTTLNTSNIVGSAPSASIMQVGDIGGELDEMDAPFTPRIVCYKGLRQLPSGESWGADKRAKKYPYAAFLDEEINLCYEDRNGLDGLHHHFLPMLLRRRDSQSIALNLRLTTAEIASLFTADGANPSLRSRFRFTINGESSLFRLAKVEQWDGDCNIVRCLFERELNDQQ